MAGSVTCLFADKECVHYVIWENSRYLNIKDWNISLQLSPRFPQIISLLSTTFLTCVAHRTKRPGGLPTDKIFPELWAANTLTDGRRIPPRPTIRMHASALVARRIRAAYESSRGPQLSARSYKPRIIRRVRAGPGYRYLHCTMLRCQITMCNKPFALVLKIWRALWSTVPRPSGTEFQIPHWFGYELTTNKIFSLHGLRRIISHVGSISPIG